MGDVMRMSELQHKDIVDETGKKIGNIIDARLDSDGKVVALVIDNSKSKFFRLSGKDSEEEVRWEKIEQIGEDVILVKNR